VSGRVRIVLIAGCALIAALNGERTGAVLAQGLEGPYADAGPIEAEAELGLGTLPTGPLLTSRGSEAALRELEPFLRGQGRGL